MREFMVSDPRRSTSSEPAVSTGDRTQRPAIVLVALDQEWAVRSLESILAPQGFAVLRGFTGRHAIDIARDAQPDAIILGMRLPDMDGIDACRELRGGPRVSPTTPIILMASHSGRPQRLAAYQAGAWEVCAQPVDGEVLLAKLQSFLACKRDTDRLRDEGLVDARSGLYNLRGLARRARELGAAASRAHEALGCVAIAPAIAGAGGQGEAEEDVISDHLGRVLSENGRLSDVIGRIGQSEFAIIAPGTGEPGLLRIVDRLRETVQTRPATVDGREYPLAISAGYCIIPDFALASIDAAEMLVRAGAALRHTRASGAPAVVSFDELSEAARS